MRRIRLPHALVFLGAATAIGLGCHRQLAQAADPTGEPGRAAETAFTTPDIPAPFSSPPVLTGTPDIAALAEAVGPAVVNITTVHEVKVRYRDLFEMFPFPFGDSFGGQQRQPREGVRKQQALGTGFIVDPSGLVVTNAHVVDGADQVRVKLADDREFQAKVKGRDKLLDLAVLELVNAPKDLPVASLGQSQKLRVGEYVVAIGNPFGLSHTVTMGIVSAKGRTIGAGPYDDFIQTDASINPGNSGGPLFNLHGQVVGINTAINPNGQGIGFAIPVDTLKQVLPQLAGQGRVARGKLGVLVQPVDAQLAKAFGLDKPRGALIGEVEADGPAAKAGLQAGDLIVEVEGMPVARSEDLPRMVAAHPPSTKLTIKVLRSRVEKTFEVTLAELRDAQGDDGGAGAQDEAGPTGLGIQVSDAPQGGAMVRGVMPNGAADGQLTPGDVILEVNQHPIANASELIREVQKAPSGQPLLLKIRRGGSNRFVAIEKK